MSTDRIKDIFVEATDLDSPEERAAYLEEACNGNPHVRQRVEALLAAHDSPASVLDEAAISPRAAVTEDVPPHEQLTERPGTIIDHYKLLQELGEGGFGVVYMAEQQEPIRRQVALKIIKPGMDTREVVARFEAERQALALMDHPNIARVLDAGATESGRPFFVMELVKGVPITDFCDKNNLPARERLKLFIEVCRAVQHAHQKGIIHRDLKPSNVMITLHDGKPVPKVIDFGVSKAINQRLTEKTLFTHYGQMVGTPQYMSPEQAEMSSLDVDTRSDIYSLGVLLYELLTGTTPLDRERLHSAGYAEMLRIIQNEEPPKPSTRLTTLRDELTVVCKHRGTDAGRLGQLLQGDLDWIVMKALEKDRGRRYETASGLAADIERHLADEPVVAGPPSAAYRLRKFAQRNQGLVASAIAIVTTLAVGLSVATFGYWQAVLAKGDAEDQRDVAQARERKARVLVDLLNELLGAANPENVKPPDYTVRQLMDDFSKGLDERLAGEPEVEAELRLTIGRAYSRLGRWDEASDQLQESLRLRKERFGAKHEMVADVLTALAWNDSRPSAPALTFAGADQRARDAIEMYDDLAVESEGKATAHIVVGTVAGVANRRPADAEKEFREALRIANTIAAGKETALVARAMSLLALFIAHQQDGREAEANALANQAIQMYQRVFGNNHPATASAIRRQGGCFALQGRLEEAEACFRRALRMMQQTLGDTDTSSLFTARFLADFLVGQHRLSDALDVCDDVIEACRAEGKNEMLSGWLYFAGNIHLTREDFEQAASAFREALSRPSGDVEASSLESRLYLAFVLLKQGRQDEAERHFQWTASRLKLIMKLPITKESETLGSNYHLGYAMSLLHNGANDNETFKEALDAARRGVELSKQVRIDRAEGRNWLPVAIAQYKLGEVDEAIRSLRTGLDAIPHDLRHSIAPRRELEVTLAIYLEAKGNVEAAEQVYRDAVDVRKEALPDGHPLIATAEARLGAFLREQMKYDEAEERLLAAEGKLRDNPEAADANREYVTKQLVALYDAWDKPEEAAHWQSQR